MRDTEARHGVVDLVTQTTDTHTHVPYMDTRSVRDTEARHGVVDLVTQTTDTHTHVPYIMYSNVRCDPQKHIDSEDWVTHVAIFYKCHHYIYE